MKIFISHSSRDRWVARRISEDLNNLGIETFLDEKDILTGESIDDAIGQHLIESDELLVIISPASLNSQWVFVEIGGAKALSKRLVPILFHVGANELPSILTRYLARDINDIETYYNEAKKRMAHPQLSQAPKSKDEKPRRRMKPALSVGDKVKIAELNDLTDKQKSILPLWVDEMDEFAGKEARVVEIRTKTPEAGQICKLDIDSGRFGWASIWLQKLK